MVLARWAMDIEKHYSAKKGHPTPMDLEWAKDGQTNTLFIVQARPETVRSREDRSKLRTYMRTNPMGAVNTLATGQSVGSNMASGVVSGCDLGVSVWPLIRTATPLHIGTRHSRREEDWRVQARRCAHHRDD
jgi:hypothetical protein